MDLARCHLGEIHRCQDPLALRTHMDPERWRTSCYILLCGCPQVAWKHPRQHMIRSRYKTRSPNDLSGVSNGLHRTGRGRADSDVGVNVLSHHRLGSPSLVSCTIHECTGRTHVAGRQVIELVAMLVAALLVIMCHVDGRERLSLRLAIGEWRCKTPGSGSLCHDDRVNSHRRKSI